MASARLAGLLVVLCAILSFGQNPTKESVPALSEKPSAPSLRVDVDLVLVHATVTDSKNRNVQGLTQDRFQLWEDKVEQNIEYFSTEDVPLSVGIILDVSGSMKNNMPPARSAANTFMRMGDQSDEYFLIVFSDSAQLTQDFTSDITRVQGRLLLTAAKGSTALYDALYLGLEKLESADNSRKALLLITDGQDNHSRYSFSDVKNFVREHDVMIYSIGITDPATLLVSGDIGKGVLEDLASLTGGDAFFPASAGQLPEICARIAAELKNQYVLGYRPRNTAGDGKWRKIKVKVNKLQGMPSLNVRARNGYYAPAFAKAAR
jgi:Ca-activated chloride channel family protein